MQPPPYRSFRRHVHVHIAALDAQVRWCVPCWMKSDAIGEYCVQHAEKSAAARDTVINNQDYRSDNIPTPQERVRARRSDLSRDDLAARRKMRCESSRHVSMWQLVGTRESITLGVYCCNMGRIGNLSVSNKSNLELVHRDQQHDLSW
jgi:hypothetical protein